MDWKKKLKELELPYREVKLKVDGHEVTYESTVSKMRVVILWYYQGRHKVEYSEINNEIGKLFGNPVYDRMTKRLYSVIKAHEGKRVADKKRKEYTKEIIMYSAFWSSPTQIIKCLSNRFQKIEVLTEN